MMVVMVMVMVVGGGEIGLLDGTNCTIERRNWIRERCVVLCNVMVYF